MGRFGEEGVLLGRKSMIVKILISDGRRPRNLVRITQFVVDHRTGDLLYCDSSRADPLRAGLCPGELVGMDRAPDALGLRSISAHSGPQPHIVRTRWVDT